MPDGEDALSSTPSTSTSTSCSDLSIGTTTPLSSFSTSSGTPNSNNIPSSVFRERERLSNTSGAKKHLKFEEDITETDTCQPLAPTVADADANEHGIPLPVMMLDLLAGNAQPPPGRWF